MLRKTSAIILTLFCMPAWSAYYIGGGVGPEMADFHQNARITHPMDLDARDATHLSGKGYFASLFGGYAWRNQTYYLAGELNVNASSVNFYSSNDELVHSTFSHTRYRMRHSWGLSLLPGFLFTPMTLFYGRVGYANGNFNSSTTDISLVNVNRNLRGLRLGVGINQAITQQVAVRMEYSQINYQSTSFTYVGAVTKHTKISPTTAQVEFGLIYSFG